MQIYQQEPSFIVDQSFTLGVQPSSTFGIALYLQGPEEALELLPACTIVSTSPNVVPRERKSYYCCFRSTGSLGPQSYGTDWGWPTVTLRFASPQLAPSGIYVAVVFPVD